MKLLILTLVFAVAMVGAPISAATYSMLNGQGVASGAGFNYWDDTYSGSGSATTDLSPLSGGLGQLTDGIISCSDDWAADCGSGEGIAYRWVGWLDPSPQITFDFGSSYTFASSSIHSLNFVGVVQLWDQVVFEFSSDGINFSGPVTRITTAPEFADVSAHYLATNLGGGTGRYVRLTFSDPGDTRWTFISEVTFDGAAAGVPEPETFGGVAIGLLLILVSFTRHSHGLRLRRIKEN